MKNYIFQSPLKMSGQMTVFGWGFQESSFKAIDSAESPVVILPLSATWNIDVMAENTALVFSP